MEPIYGNAKFNKNKEIVVVKKYNEDKVLARILLLPLVQEPKKIQISENFDNLGLLNYFDAMIPQEIPKKLGIIGSGAIGIEFAEFL